METVKEIWVIDTSSILEVQRSFEKSIQNTIYDELTKLVERGSLVFPSQVYDELKRYSNASNLLTDSLFEWVNRNKSVATRFGHRYEELREVLGHLQVRNILDSEKIGVEEADSHILSLALFLKQKGDPVSVITQERKDRFNKLSLNTACGLLKINCLPIEPFLIEQNIL